MPVLINVDFGRGGIKVLLGHGVILLLHIRESLVVWIEPLQINVGLMLSLRLMLR